MTTSERPVRIRPAVAGDARALCSLSISAIRRSATRHYTSSELDAWAGRRTVRAHEQMIDRTAVLVAVAADGVAGFVAVALEAAPPLERGEVDQLFVSPAHDGRGIGRRLLAAAEDVAREAGVDELVTHASWRAVPVFERSGWAQVRTETVPMGDELLTRALMHKPLDPR